MALIRFYDKLKKITKVMGAVSGFALAAIMVFTIIITLFRYVFKIPILGSNELVEVTLSVCIFASMAYGQTEKSHVNLFLILMKLPKKIGIIIFAIDMIIATGACGFVSYGLLQQGLYAYKKGLVTVLRSMHLHYFYFIGFACFAVFTFVMLIDTLIVIGGIFNSDLRQQTTSTWS